MRIVSDTHTNESGGESVPPGTPFECPDKVAKEKIDAGRARPARDEDGPDFEPDLADDDDEEGRIEGIAVAILEMDRDDASLWTEGGAPTVEAVSVAFGEKVTAAERDAAMATLDADGDDE